MWFAAVTWFKGINAVNAVRYRRLGYYHGLGTIPLRFIA